jgi:stage II sporulation protein D
MLVAGIALVLVGGCSCEGPKHRMAPPRAAGREVPVVRVRLGDEAPTVSLAVQGPWRLANSAGQLAAGQTLEWTEVTCQGASITFGQQPPASGTLELRPENDGTLWVGQTVAGRERQRCYRGVLRLIPTGSGTMRLVSVLPLEHYVAGVVANEMIKTWHVEAFKAQAVAARTYALAHLNTRGRDFDVYDSVLSQVYGGAGTETKTAWDSVIATWGVAATYREGRAKPVLLSTLYHSTCGGATAPSGTVFGGTTTPPLAGAPCVYCRNSPKWQWPDVVLTKQEIGEALKKTGYTDLVRLGPVRRVEVAATTGEGGRAESIRVVDTSGRSVLVLANFWRGQVGSGKVPSTWFTIEDQGDRIVLKDGRGFGHGVGLCQWGAEYLAERGKTGEEILRFYYPGVLLSKAY